MLDQAGNVSSYARRARFFLDTLVKPEDVDEIDNLSRLFTLEGEFGAHLRLN
jgi:hypothetical protein